MKDGNALMKNKCNVCNRLDPTDNYFQAILICAVRYSIGLITCAPELVTRYIEPLLPQMTDNTLDVMRRAVEEPEMSEFGSYGDECDKETWMRFLGEIKMEEERRKNDGRA